MTMGPIYDPDVHQGPLIIPNIETVTYDSYRKFLKHGLTRRPLLASMRTLTVSSFQNFPQRTIFGYPRFRSQWLALINKNFLHPCIFPREGRDSWVKLRRSGVLLQRCTRSRFWDTDELFR